MVAAASESLLVEVDAGGNPVTTVESGTDFDFELANSADSTAGTIHYAATMLGGSLSGDITVATIRFKAISPTSGDWLRFQVWPPQKTDVTYLGQSVLTAWPAASVTVEGYVTPTPTPTSTPTATPTPAGRIYLPLIPKEASGGGIPSSAVTDAPLGETLSFPYLPVIVKEWHIHRL